LRHLPFGSVLADAPKSKNASDLVTSTSCRTFPARASGVLVEYGPGGYSPDAAVWSLKRTLSRQRHPIYELRPSQL
jgi:hypothetical protein